MPVRRWINVVAIRGVLLHAGMIFRHNAVMVNAKLQHLDLVTSLRVICSADGSTTRPDASGMPSENNADCPVCAGALQASAMLPDIGHQLARPDMTSARIATVGQTIAVRLTAAWPSPRGPPALI